MVHLAIRKSMYGAQRPPDDPRPVNPSIYPTPNLSLTVPFHFRLSATRFHRERTLAIRDNLYLPCLPQRSNNQICKPMCLR
jgi:hypothetical protein